MNVFELLEPQVAAIDNKLATSLEAMTSLSIAISLKRIAEAMWGDPGTTGIVELLNSIERRHGSNG